MSVLAGQRERLNWASEKVDCDSRCPDINVGMVRSKSKSKSKRKSDVAYSNMKCGGW